MDFYTKCDIESSINRIDELLRCGIFLPENLCNPLVRSALTELLILVRDLMEKAKKYAEPVEFTDDVNITNKVSNVHQLIKFVRDAICHVDSENRNHDGWNARLSFNIVYGKYTLLKSCDVEVRSDYDDDICFFFGDQRLYLRRHIVRAYEDAKAKLRIRISIS